MASKAAWRTVHNTLTLYDRRKAYIIQYNVVLIYMYMYVKEYITTCLHVTY